MKTQTITKDSIIEAYSDYILIHGERPKNIYQFTKDLNTTEQEFYKYYGNFEAIERDYLKILFEKSLELSITAEGYASQSSKEKLLNLYYIFIENLTLNRSFVLELLKGNARQMMIKMPSRSEKDGSINLENTLMNSGLDTYYVPEKIAKLSYAKPNSEPQFLIY